MIAVKKSKSMNILEPSTALGLSTCTTYITLEKGSGGIRPEAHQSQGPAEESR